MKLDQSGTLQWQSSLGGTDRDVAHDICQTGDGGYLIIGDTDSNDGDVTANHGSQDYWVVKLNSAGALEWQKCFGGSGVEYSEGVALTGDGGCYIVGTAHSNNMDVIGNHGASDAWVIRLGPETVGITEAGIGWLDVYPNPTDGAIEVLLPLENADVIVSDALGRPVLFRHLVGTRSQLDLWGVAPGVYAVRVTAGQRNYIGSVVVR